MSDDLNNMTADQIRRLLRARVGPRRQCLNPATQEAIDATLTYGNLRSELANEEPPSETFNDYFKFGGG
jgi:hypothetical protein